ncbi:hypothetical protein LTR27_007146 [Elasticomyces elasticus]|nr:hypothetical protein LTR27_007146 [Elasticomyces elasticus]
MAAKRPAEDIADGARKRSRSDYNATLTVLVGAEETSFTVHQDHICRASDFFKKACSGDWLESKERTVRLADVDAAMFQIYVEGLYFPSNDLKEMLAETLSSPDDETEPLCVTTCKRRDVDSILQLCSLWALGDYLQDYRIQNKVMDILHQSVIFVAFGSVRIMTWVSAHTTAASLLANYLRATFVELLKESKRTPAILDELKQGENKLPADVLVDLLKEMLSSTYHLSLCATYRVHPEGTETCAQLRAKSKKVV